MTASVHAIADDGKKQRRLAEQVTAPVQVIADEKLHCCMHVTAHVRGRAEQRCSNGRVGEDGGLEEDRHRGKRLEGLGPRYFCLWTRELYSLADGLQQMRRAVKYRSNSVFYRCGQALFPRRAGAL